MPEPDRLIPVTLDQVEAAKLLTEIQIKRGVTPSPSVIAIANAVEVPISVAPIVPTTGRRVVPSQPVEPQLQSLIVRDERINRYGVATPGVNGGIQLTYGIKPLKPNDPRLTSPDIIIPVSNSMASIDPGQPKLKAPLPAVVNREIDYKPIPIASLSTPISASQPNRQPDVILVKEVARVSPQIVRGLVQPPVASPTSSAQRSPSITSLKPGGKVTSDDENEHPNLLERIRRRLR